MEITLSNDNLTLNIKGVRNETDETGDDKIEYHQMQIFYGMFEKDINLPPSVSIDRDNISAKYNDGMLIIKIPKNDNGGKVSIRIQD